ncbi:carbohydrate-binding protein [Acidisarcina polymorpha]|nr:carbohydrate-binding protein [Acidisarcina polymorpha]
MLFPRFTTSVYALIAALLGVGITGHGQVVGSPPSAPALNYTTNWLGNTLGGANISSSNQLGHIPLDMQGIYVTSNGTVYTNSNWDEGGRATSIFQNGTITSADANGGGGQAIVVSGSTIYESNSSGVTNNPPCAAGGCGIQLLNASTLAALSTTISGDSAVSSTGSAAIYGLAIGNGNLYAAINDQNKVDVISLSSNSVTATWNITAPGLIAVDSSGGVWISHKTNTALPNVNGIVNDEWGDFGTAVIDHYNSSGTHINSITLPDSGEVRALWIDSNNNLYAGDENTDQNIKIYNNILSSPTLSGTFGTQGGVYTSSTPGVVAPGRFRFITGIGTDSSGNIYVSDDDYGHGVLLSSYTSSGSLNWQVQGLEFVSLGAVDPNSETDFYDPYHHFHLNYSDQNSNIGTYYSDTFDPYQYTTDVRATGNPNIAEVQYIQGSRFLLLSDQAGGYLQINRFQSGSEITVPCAALDYGAFQNQYLDFSVQPTNGEFIWTDANGDGIIQSSEIAQPTSAAALAPAGQLEHRDGNDFWMDTNGNLWQVNYYSPDEGSIHIREYLFQGFNSHGCPQYNFNNLNIYTNSTDFPQISGVSQVVYRPGDSEKGTIYIAGGAPSAGAFDQITRVDNWSSGNRTPTWTNNIVWNPGTASGSTLINPVSFSIAGNYIFVDYNAVHYVLVYSTVDGSYVGEIDAGSDVGGDSNIGNDDMWLSTTAFERSNGQYVITKEEDYQAKNLLYVWTPAGTESQTATPALSPGGGTYTSSQSVTISDSTTGAIIYYTTNGTAPTTSSTKYTGSISVTSTETVQAIATASGYSTSNVGNATYTISSCSPAAITPYIWTSAGGWQQITSISVASGTAVDLGPQPTSGGSWSWTGPGGFTSTSREIDSIPLSAGTNTFVATYTNSCGANSTETFTITVTGSEGPYGGTAAAIPGTVQASNYDTGGSGVAYNQTTSGGQTGYRTDNSGAVEADSGDNNSPANGYDLGWTGSGQWYKYTVNVATAGTYTVSFSVASPSGQTDGFHMQNSSGTNLSGNVNVPNTGSWYTWQTVTASVTLPAGTQTLELAEDNSGWNLEYMTFASNSSGTEVSLNSAFNITGIYSNGTTFSSSGGLDDGGAAYSSNLLGTSLTYSGIVYAFGTANQNNAVQGTGAPVVTLTSGSYSTLNFLGTASSGNQASQLFTVTYTDGTTTNFTQSMSDWFTPQSYSGETTAVACSYRNLSNGTEDSRTFNLYHYSFALNSAKTVKSLTLPNNSDISVAAVTLK